MISAILGLFAYGEAKREGSGAALNSWALATALLIGAILAYWLDLWAEPKGDGYSTKVVVEAVAVFAFPAALGGLLVRRTDMWNLSPRWVGGSVFLASYLLINILFFVLRLKEPL